ncbi:PREDICTED: E3 ubiquitin-protein ligase MIB2-like [Nicrophorus vespilloides]|uniref:E3 ubiquitin-protein ligase MIB2-like n=1 Tax=Nicrophorus vespilloides TaxID=110193 RepID=A0ABM1MKV1_NICVS|nr:PREDICTED: E3 ubiquitin-protein ligase MIB2-like [Nicrophorus vespilloides]XP_017775201.1 PREDICTED: E3 ubiquitin-protein ligase MIB2-like [Nicrophorus vespilloides]
MSSGNSLPKREDENQDFQKSRINYYVTHLPVLGKLENEIVVMEPTSDTILNQLIQEVDSWQNRTKIPSETPVCLLCDKTSEHNVTFIPCNHKLACTNCSIYVKKCYSCHVSVEKRVAPDGTDLPIVCKYKDRLDAIRSQLLRIEENFACGICMENIIDIAFECGHRACSRCIENLRGKCHMCRQPISMTIEI